jgi:hypothetical protein
MTSQSVSSTEVTTADLETNATTKIGELVPEDLDGITKDGTFRGATAALLAGQIKVGEWEWFAVRRLNRLVDIPYVGEATEKGLFSEAFEAVGALLEGLLLTTSKTKFRAATLDLLQGNATTEEWLDAAADVLDALVDISYLPAVQRLGNQLQPAVKDHLLAHGRQVRDVHERVEAVGAALEGLLLTTADTEFRAATLDLLQGKATTQEWLDAAADVLDALVDISYLPRVGEEMIFDRGLELIAKALHGLLTGGSAK